MLCAKFGWNSVSGSGVEDFFLFCQCIFAISYLFPLGKGRSPLFEQTWIPSNPRMLCSKFGWNWPSGSAEEDENVKSLRQQQQRRRRTTDKF